MPKTKILLVDDNTDIVEMIGIRLEANGYDVTAAFNGADAIAKAQSESPDLILLDISMPGLDGLEVGMRLKQNSSTKEIPIIMVTAKADREDILKAISDAGAVEYVIKPFRPELLLEKIAHVLEKKR